MGAGVVTFGGVVGADGEEEGMVGKLETLLHFKPIQWTTVVN